jgi:hypothetical protein
MTVAEILSRFQEPVRTGDQWLVKCPAHDDRQASLAIREGDDGRILLHCHAGCSRSNILAALGLEAADLFPPKSGAPSSLGTIDATYDYCDAGGHLLYQVVRYRPKDFRQRCPDGHGGWIHKLNGVARVPYRLPDLKGREAIVICEGEKDVEALWRVNIPATCNVGGAGKWRDLYATQLKAAGVQRVRVLPDNDDPGRDHANEVARSCLAAGLDARVVMLPELPLKGDVSDFLATHPASDLREFLKAAPIWTPPAVQLAAPPAVPREPKSTKKKTSSQGRTVELENPDPWPDPVAGDALLEAIVGLLRAFVVFETPAYADALALWILHTYLMDAWWISPLAVANSPTMRCGKTTLVQLVAQLASRPLTATNISPAALFRMIEKAKPTLILDEAETFLKENEELRGIVNGGHTKATANVIRTVGDSHEPAYFSTWCPKFLALIGRLPATLMDRALVIPMRRKGPTEQVEPLRLDRIAARMLPMRRQMVRWADDHGTALMTADPEMPPMADDRAADNWRPLLALADAAGPGWGARARQVATEISGRQEDDDHSPLALLRDTRTVFDELDSTVTEATSAQLVERLNKLQDRPWADFRQGKGLTPAWFAARMKDFGVYPGGPYRFTVDGTSKQLRGYRRASFADAFDRYLRGDQTVTVSQAQQRRPELAVSRCNTPIGTLHPESVTTPITMGLCDDVTVSDSGSEKGPHVRERF